MKKIIFSLFLFASAPAISFAQTNVVQTKDSSSAQVEFYSSIEEFNEKNPSYFIQATVSVIIEEVNKRIPKDFTSHRKENLACQ